MMRRLFAVAGQNRRWEPVWLAGCVLVGATLRVVNLGATPLWNDEIITVITLRRPLAESLLQRMDYAAPLYALLLRLFVSGERPGEALLRAPAAVFGILGIVATWWLARTLFDRRVAALVALLVALNPPYIHYAREARPYTLWILAATMTLTLGHRLVTQGGAWRLGGFVVSGLVLVYSHYYGLFTLLAVFVFAGLDWAAGAPGRGSWRLAAKGFALVGLGALPALWLVSRYAVIGLPGTVGWIPPTGFVEALVVLGGLISIHGLGPLCLIPLASAFWPGPTLFDRASGAGAEPDVPNTQAGAWRERRAALLCALSVLFGLFGLVLAGKLYRPLLVSRYALPVVGPMLVLGVAYLRAVGHGVAPVGMALLLALSLAPAWQETRVRPGMREVVAHLRDRSMADTRLLVLDHAYGQDYVSPEVVGLAYYGLAVAEERLTRFRFRPAGLVLENPEVLSDPSRLSIVCFLRSARERELVAAGLRRWRREFEAREFGTLTVFDVAPLRGPADVRATGEGG